MQDDRNSKPKGQKRGRKAKHFSDTEKAEIADREDQPVYDYIRNAVGPTDSQIGDHFGKLPDDERVESRTTRKRIKRLQKKGRIVSSHEGKMIHYLPLSENNIVIGRVEREIRDFINMELFYIAKLRKRSGKEVRIVPSYYEGNLQLQNLEELELIKHLRSIAEMRTRLATLEAISFRRQNQHLKLDKELVGLHSKILNVTKGNEAVFSLIINYLTKQSQGFQLDPDYPRRSASSSSGKE